MLINTEHVKVSRRNAFLMLFGAAYVMVGYSYMNIPEVFKPILHAQFRFALNIAPIEFYGWMWIAFGVAAFLGGVIHAFDAVGFAAGVFMPLVWSLFSFIAEIQDGVPRAWVSGVLYLLIGCAVWIVSGTADPFGNVRLHRWRHK